MFRKFVFGLALAIPVVALGCGGESTTVVKEAPVTVEKTTTIQAPPKPVTKPARSSSATPEEANAAPSGEAPEVTGLPLDVAEHLLKEAGYKAAATNTDTAFGIVVPSHYTVCTQAEPRGKFVPLLAQKYGC